MLRCDKHLPTRGTSKLLVLRGERILSIFVNYLHLRTSIYTYLQSSTHIYMTSADSVPVISYSTNLHLAIGLPDMYSDETMRIFCK